MSPRRLAASLVATLLTAGVLAGCGQNASPGSADPALKAGLDQVDAAIASGDLSGARTAAEQLVANTTQSQRDGDISGDEANRILTAVNDLIAQLPSPSPSVTALAKSQPTAAPTKTTAPPPTKPKPAAPHSHGHGKGRGHSKHHDD